ncbi:hypothetical protein [Halomonas sp. HAL1]|uniref:hypothetical protein n=1 Tax=Halomonas sp. HAL1 TaxID=550984 RepID=UPI0002EB6EC1|nr:hypothetical protein [Halomonas sp. HAL1]WKV91753.1 hypothetical protein Q3Y66_12820 [Halomonas sp. HAL1]
MKINVEFDLTPDEFRQSLGLPDVEAFQKNLLENIQRQMESGVEGYDPMSLMRPFLQQPMMQQGLSQGLANFGTYQQMMLDMLRQAGSASASSAHSNEDEKSGGTSSKSNSESATSSKAKSTASSRSRSRSESKRSGT